MWATVVVLAFVAATDPLRLGWAVVLISQPRPIPNLLAFWFGGMTTGIAVAVSLLVLLRAFALRITQTVSSAVASSTVRHIQLTTGVLALLIATVIAVRRLARQRAKLPVPTSASSAQAPQSSAPAAFSWLPTRVRNALEAKFLWVAFGVGLRSATNPVESLIALAVILESGAATGTQVGAAVMFTVAAAGVLMVIAGA
jgi:Sap-like sulfolipid-1-addressing protein